MTQEKAIQEAKQLLLDTICKNVSGFTDFNAIKKAVEEYASSSSEKGEVTDMAVCEINHLILHENQLYRFKKHEGCKGCEEYNGVAHQSSKQFSLKETLIEYTKFIKQHDYFGKMPKNPIQGYVGEYLQTVTPKEHSEGECTCSANHTNITPVECCPIHSKK